MVLALESSAMVADGLEVPPDAFAMAGAGLEIVSVAALQHRGWWLNAP